MIDFIIGAIVAVIVGAALAYIIRSRKNGVQCIGCPHAKSCTSCSHTKENGSACGCHSELSADGGCHTDAK